MSEKDILKFLQNLGFSKREVQVYMFLAKSGAQSTSFVAKRLKMERVQAYRTFKKLQEKGFIEATLERPTRFTVVPFTNLLDSFIEAKRGEVENLNSQKESLLSSWKIVSAPESDYTVAKFSVISGKKKIHAKMLTMIEEAKKSIYVLTTSLGIIQEDIGGVLDAIIDASEDEKLQLKIITDINKDNFRIMERLGKRGSSENAKVEVRHLNLNSRYFPRFLIKDDEEAILYASSGDETTILNIEDEGLWINDKMFISVLKAFFNQMWQIGVNAELRVDEIKTGTPIGETTIIKDPNDAWKRVEQSLDKAKEDVILIASSQSINSIIQKDPFAKYHKTGLKFKLMAPLDLDNLDAAKKLSPNYEIRHVPINYMTIMLIDDRDLFMFGSPPINDLEDKSIFYLTDTYYTNDRKSSERLSEMLKDTWKRGTEIAEITSQAAGIRLPTSAIADTETLSSLATMLLRNNGNSALITENGKAVGLINDRELLREVVQGKKNPEKTLAKDLDYTPLLMLNENQTMTDALKLVREKGQKRVAVVKNGQLVGMLTQDLAKRPTKQ